MNREEFTKFTASLHTHVRSLYDANIDAQKLCAKIKEMGGKGCAITDHGTLSSIEDYRAAFAKEDLKLIPGCELYVDGGILGREHLVVLAVNDRGYKGICKVVTDANRTLSNDFPVITEERFFEISSDFKDDIIVLSGCMQGVVCAPFMLNSKVQEKIDKLVEKQSKYIDPSSDEVTKAEEMVEKATKIQQETILLRDETKRIAEQKFTNREKAVAKAENGNLENAVSLRNELESDKVAAAKAQESLPEVKKAVDTVKKELSAANKALKEINESVNKFLAYEDQIIGLKKEMKPEAEVFLMAKQVAGKYQEAFGQNFFLEVQNHNIPQENICFPQIVKIAEELGIELVATNDVHILEKNKDERLRRQILRSLRFGKSPHPRFEEENIGDEELYLKDNMELAEILLEILPEDTVKRAIANIDVIFDKCNVEFKVENHYPKFSQTEDADVLIEEAVKKGVAWRFPEGMDEEHQKRLDYELPIIKSMGYSDYHLIVKDFLEYGRLLSSVPNDKLDEAPLTIEELKFYIKKNGWKQAGITIGPGRGSAVGSLVCYVLGITNLDPIKYDLLFERFLNPERISMPDIDSDFGNLVRGKVIEYVKNKYGEMAVCGIMTTTMQQPKGSINIAAKYYGLKMYDQAMTALGKTIAKCVPKEVNVKFATMVTANGQVADEKNPAKSTLGDYLLNQFSENADAVEIIKWALVIEGSFTAYGAHAAGIVISDNADVSDYIPLRMNNSLGMFTTQCDMVQVEENGLLKFDFLGLKTLDIITEVVRMIYKNYGVIIDPLAVDLTDHTVYEKILATGKTNSVFQFESDGMKTMLKRFSPDCFEDLIILVSMFRPGPLQYLDGVIDVKNGKNPMTFLCPELEPILGKTYGAIVYQEQVMEIVQKLAGYSLGGADQVRRYMSKKKEDKLAHERIAFIDGDPERNIKGCVTNGISREIASQLFDQMEDFAKYAFNKSHAAAYAFVAYITAWFKCYYPAEFIASALNWAENKKIAGLMYEASILGVKTAAPDITVSSKEFCVENNVIMFGLSNVAGVKDHANEIISERQNGNYQSLIDFIERVNPNIAVIDHLISAGGLDAFSKNRKAMKNAVEELREPLKTRNQKASFVKSVEYVLPIIEKFTSKEELIKYQEDAGLKVEVSELTTAEKLEKRLENAKNALSVINKEISMIKVRECEEDKSERMALEKEFLGVYVTQHPLDFYPKAEDVKSHITADVIEKKNCDSAYGVISNLSIKQRKKDGKAMAFFTLEDRSGAVDVAVFTQAYASYKEQIQEGKVVLLNGVTNVEEAETEDAEDKITFFADKVTIIKEKKSPLMMSVSSYPEFHTTCESYFIEEYQDSKGYPLLIFDQAADEVREALYCVNEKAKLLPNVEEVFL